MPSKKKQTLTMLTIVTYNIYVEGYDNQITLNAIADLDADIIVLQEANKHWMKAIKADQSITSKFRNIDFSFSYNGYEGGSIVLCRSEHRRIKCRYHIQTTRKGWYRMHSYLINLADLDADNTADLRIQLQALEQDNDANNLKSDDWRNKGQNEGIFFDLVTENDLLLHSIHLVAPWPLQGECCCCNIWSLFECSKYHKSKIRRDEMVHNFRYYQQQCIGNRDDIISSIPTIACGDFNCRNGPCHDYLKDELSFKRAFEVISNWWCCCKHEPASWRGMWCKMFCFAPKCFDHVYYKNINIKESMVMYGVGDSDHWPVQAVFEL